MRSGKCVCLCESMCPVRIYFIIIVRSLPRIIFLVFCCLAYQPIAMLPGLALQLFLDQQTSGSSCLHISLPVLRLANLGVLLSPPTPLSAEISKPGVLLSPPPALRSANLGVPLSPPTPVQRSQVVFSGLIFHLGSEEPPSGPSIACPASTPSTEPSS